MQYITEAEIDRIASETGKRIAKESKVTLVIQPENGEAFWEGGINGHFFRIKTDTPVAIPESLAKLIEMSAKVRRESQTRLRPYEKSGGRRVG